jgi:alcohol dehydrogenase (cytochrome c)
MPKVTRRLIGRASILAATLFATAASAQAPAPMVIQPNRDATYQSITQNREKLLQGLTPVDDAMQKSPPPGDWLNWRRTYDGQGNSPLKQINKSNVSKMQLNWSFSLPQSPNETTPLVHNGVIFVIAGAVGSTRVIAFDGTDGSVLWQFVRAVPAGSTPGSAIAKNMALSGNKLFVATPDRHVIALDVKTGAVIWDTVGVDPVTAEGGPAMTGGPVVVKDKVIIGLANCFRVKGGCFITAFDANTGKMAWRFNTIPKPGEAGGDTWNGAPGEERFGSSVWTAASYDPELGLIYIGTAQTYDVTPLLINRPGATGLGNNDALYTNSTLALDPETGKLVWHYQHFNGDVWDLDWVFERTLMTLKVDGKDRKVVATAGKLGIFDILDRKTGQYLFSRDLGYQTLVKDIDKTTGKKIIDPKFAPEINKTKTICPNAGGGRNWNSTAYNPETRIMFVPIVEACMYYTWLERPATETLKGGLAIRWQLALPEKTDGNFGEVRAIDLTTGKTVWNLRHRAAEASALLSTDGGLLFEGSRDRKFRALDQKDGSTLWETGLPAQPSTFPITYTANGKQYVAVIAGGGGVIDGYWGPLTPELTTPVGGTTLMVFALPDAKR